MKNTRENIYLTALLHGMYRFWLHSTKNAEGSSDHLNNFADFIAKAGLHDIIPDNDIIEKAERLAAGTSSPLEYNNGSTQRSRLVPLIGNILKNDEHLCRLHIPARRLSLSKGCFPAASNMDDDNTEQLWKDFLQEFNSIKSLSTECFAETLLNLLLKYTVNLPASPAEPDVPLFDSIKMTAAISICLSAIQESTDSPDSPFLLIGGDISGIQPYIYMTVSKYAGKSLKGRSYYIRLLSDAIVRYIIKELDLTRANIIYNSGGSFYILSPNTDEISARLTNVIRSIEEKMFTTHRNNLYVAIDSVEIGTDSFLCGDRDGRLPEKWGELFLKRDRKKSSCYAAIIRDNYNDFFCPSMSGGVAALDTVTGEEFLPGEKPVKEGGLVLKKTSYEQILLGKTLRDTDIVAVSTAKIKNLEGTGILCLEPTGLGIYYYFLDKKDFKLLPYDCQETGPVSIVTFNGKDGDCNFIPKTPQDCIYELDFYGGNEFNGHTFEEMCENSKFSRMGVLSMDVDNLGNIFQNGIEKRKATLPRFSALSRSFDFFFSGYINTIWKETAPDKTFIIYSGGDDLFITGDWAAVIHIAKRIRNDFNEFCCHNDTLSISGGIAIVDPKFPIIKAANESKDEEQNAKYHSVSGQEKNSISFLDMPLNWDNEFPAVEKLKDRIISAMSSSRSPLPGSFISKLMSYKENAGIKAHRITNIKTYWLLAYVMKRLKERIKANQEAISLIDSCVNEICCNTVNTLGGHPVESGYHSLELWSLACRWAELESRSDKGTVN